MSVLDAHLRFGHYLGKRAHLGVCGSVAAYKTLEVLRGLAAANLHVSATLTDAAAKYVAPLTFEALGAAPLYGPMYPPGPDVYGHLEPAQNGDVLIIAPATANILAKLAHGLADDMLSCQALAFEGPLVVAPAMNPRMWNAPATRANWETLLSRGVVGLVPQPGEVACGEEGRGRLTDVREIILAALRAVSVQDMAGKRVLVNLGPTREPWDAVRFISNPSSGTMGAALAVAAWLRGAEATAVCGPVDLWLPEAITRVDVTTAQDMYDACTQAWPAMDMGCLTAAVSDFAPLPVQGKLKKDALGQSLTLELSRTPDVLKTLGERKQDGQLLVGFAAETGGLESAARAKLEAKNLDLIAANRVGGVGEDPGAFGSDRNEVLVLAKDDRLEHWPKLPKTEVAWRIWDLVCGL